MVGMGPERVLERYIRKLQCANIAKVMNTSKFLDVTFIVGSDQTEFKANRMLLALVSNVFDSMLYGPMEEGKPNSVITIEDIDADGFQCVLNFAHAKHPEITMENVASVKHICRKYGISDLAQQCDMKIDRCISAENICIVLDHSIKYKLEEYVPKCMDKMDVIGHSAREIVKSEGFMEMGMESLRLMLQCDDLRIREDKLWDAVIKWTLRKSKEGLGAEDNNTSSTGIDEEPPSQRRRLNSNRSLPSGNVNQSDLLRSVCPYIRFGLMDSKYFSEKVKPTGCLSKDELIAVLEYMTMKQSNPDYQCGKFSTKSRQFETRLMKFQVFLAPKHGLSKNRFVIFGTGDDCCGYWIYPETLKESGYMTGRHFWSLQLIIASCFRDVAVVSRRKPVIEIGASKIGGRNVRQRSDSPDTVSMYKGTVEEDGDVIYRWKTGQILTAVLDCDLGCVTYFIDGTMRQKDNIEKGNPYWFGMIMCAGKCHCRVVETPDRVVASFDN